MNYYEILKVLFFRFSRAFIAGAVATMVIITPNNIQDWKQLGAWLSALALAGTIGGITGLLMAVDKWIRVL